MKQNILVIGGNGKTGSRVAENFNNLGTTYALWVEKQIQILIGKI